MRHPGSNEAPPVENWRIHRRLIGHDNDVQDLGWSCDSSILVTVGLDSKIVVWSGHNFEKLKTISQHSSQVKGITFDPANKFFATASDDRTVRIFHYTPPEKNATSFDQTNNFTLETIVADPFATSPLTTYFRRPSWSPDGASIVCANATNGPVTTAAIIQRGNWDSSMHLIGHEGPIEVCAFSPRLFSMSEKGDDDQPSAITVVACAGQDRNLSIWSTMGAKPFATCENVTLKSISDLAWTPSGESLFFTSLDGTIALCQFEKGELGYPQSFDINVSSLQKYGGSGKVAMVEGPDGQMLEDQSKEDEMRNVQGRMGELMGDGPSTSDTGFAAIPLTNGVSHVNGQTNGDGTKATTSDKPPVNGHADPKEDPRIERLKNRVTITKDGKKRVAPLLVSDAAGSTQSSLPQSQLMSAQNRTARTDAPQNILDLSKPFDGFPKGGLTSLFLGNKRKLAETGAEDDDASIQRIRVAQQEGTTPILLNTTEGLTLPSEAASRPSDMSSFLSVAQTRLAVPTVRATFQRPQNPNPGPTPSNSSEDTAITLTVRNSLGPPRTGGNTSLREPTRITATKRTALLWQDYLPRAITLLTTNSRFTTAACEDGSLHIWSPAGRRIFNAFALEAQIAILDCRGPYLLAITAVGMCHIWNIERSSSPHPPVSLGPVLEMASQAQGPHLSGGPGIIFARLNSEGRIVLAMSNGDAFAYSSAMYTWQRLSEAWWAVGSQYWNSSDAVMSHSTSTSGAGGKDDEVGDVVKPENISASIIATLERNTNSQTQVRGRAYLLQRLIKLLLSAEGYEGLESSVSVAHLENRVAAALTLGDKEGFRVYLGMYAKRLGQEMGRLKIEELLRSLLRGVWGRDGEDEVGVGADGDRMDTEPFPGRGADVEGGSEMLCGWKKSVLLREVVLILGELLLLCFALALRNRQNSILTRYRKIPRPPAHHCAVCTPTRYDGGSSDDIWESSLT